MLVLTRGVGQKIKIGNDVEILISSVKGDRVRVGIAAPSNVAVHRMEVLEKVERERLAVNGNPRPVM